MKSNSKHRSRRFTALAAVAAPLLLAGLLSACGAAGSIDTTSAANNTGADNTGADNAAAGSAGTTGAAAPHRQAYDPVTGTMVTVYQPAGSTPVEPTPASHPDTDDMGTVTAEHGGGAPEHGGSTGAGAPAVRPALAGLYGIDVSSHQGNVNWNSVAPHVRYVYAKATEGTTYRNPYFANQYNGPYKKGVIRGAYHFGLPNDSSGAAQANYFLAHGGGWSKDGKTLPGALDIEYNPYGLECYRLSPAQMTNWIWSFVSEYAYKTGVFPVIYSTYDWWHSCTSSSTKFAKYDPLWIANYNGTSKPYPAGYTFYTWWQYASHGGQPGDQDVFNGAYSQLQKIARG